MRAADSTNDAPSSSSITYLPFGAASRRRPPVPRSFPATSPPQPTHARPTAARIKEKLTRLQHSRVVSFFRAKATRRETERALLSASAGGGTSSSGLARLVSAALAATRRRLERQRQWRVPWLSSLKAAAIVPAAWRRKLAAVADALSRSPTVRGIIGLASTAYRKFVGPTRAEKRELELRAREDARRRAQCLVRLCASLAKLLALRRRAARRVATKSFAARVAAALLVHPRGRVAELLVWRSKDKFARVIQRCWRRARRARTAHGEGKARVLALLARVTSRLEGQEHAQRSRATVRVGVCEAAAAAATLGARERLAARLLQRVWRGYRARRRAFSMSEWRRKQAMRDKVRARARAAKAALLAPTSEALAQRRQLTARAIARKQRTPFVFPTGFRREQREAVDAAADWKAHSPALAPLQFTSAPPRVSSLTRAKTMRVPFAKFEKMRAQHARVNMDNVWVAIPVAHHNKAEVAPSSSHPRLRSKFLDTQYDWVPAALLRRPHETLEHAQDAGAGGQGDQRPGKRSAATELLIPPRSLAS